MITFMAASLVLSIISLSVQKFRARRIHGVLLILLYITFVVAVILTEANVLKL
jgi:hypothetical protein